MHTRLMDEYLLAGRLPARRGGDAGAAVGPHPQGHWRQPRLRPAARPALAREALASGSRRRRRQLRACVRGAASGVRTRLPPAHTHPPSTPSFTGVCVGGERAARLARQLRRAEERRLADLVASAPTEARTAAGRRAAGRSGGRGGRHGGFAHAAEAPPEGVERPHGAHSLSNQLMN